VASIIYPSAVDIYRLWELGSRFFQLLIAVGIGLALFDLRPGAYLMIAGLVGLLLTRLTIALVEYRRVMSRPWPQVAPLADDDW
jgi:hypothetical protein